MAPQDLGAGIWGHREGPARSWVGMEGGSGTLGDWERLPGSWGAGSWGRWRDPQELVGLLPGGTGRGPLELRHGVRTSPDSVVSLPCSFRKGEMRS